MTDHNLPPERRLDDATRAQMRAELTEAAARDETTERRTWLVPVLAAAAMVGIAALGAGLAFGGDDGPGSTREIVPAGSGTADPTTSTDDRKEQAGKKITKERARKEVASRAPDEVTIDVDEDGMVPPEPPGACVDEINSVFPVSARLEATIDYDEGTAELWTDGNGTWALCDDWAAQSDGGAPTVIGNRAMNDPAVKQTYALSENYSMTDHSVGQFIAGGPKLPGVKSISYTFPDGHTEDAVIKKDMWLMAYVPTSGPLVGQQSPTEPIHVEITKVGGSTMTYDLQWGQDTCAQVNHGC